MFELLFLIFFITFVFRQRNKQQQQNRRQAKNTDPMTDALKKVQQSAERQLKQQRNSKQNITRRKPQSEENVKRNAGQQQRLGQMNSPQSRTSQHASKTSQDVGSHSYESVFDEFGEGNLENELSELNHELAELDDFYHDSWIEDSSWLEVDEPSILQQVETTENKRPRRTQQQKMFSNRESIRQGIIFSEIISRPKSIRD